MLELHLSEGRLCARGLRRVRCVALRLADLAGADPPVEPSLVAQALRLWREPTFLYERRSS